MKRTTLAGDSPVPAPDLIGRDFTAEAVNQRWCGDITYVKTWQGWAYLATVIDLHSRAVVGWAIAEHLRTELVTAALDMAITRRRPAAGVIFHSDRGCQGGFNRWTQHRCLELIVADRRELRLVSSNRASCGAVS
jgi:putative transposase